MKLRVIKVKDFVANEANHKHYTCAYKGRVFGISSLRFEEGDFIADDTTLTLKCEVEVLKRDSTDPLTGEAKTFLDIVPKVGISLAAF